MNLLRNVVIVNDFGVVEGGASKIALTTAASLASTGLRVTVFCGGTERSDVPENVHVVMTGQTSLANLPIRPASVTQGVWNRTSQRMLSDLLAGMNPQSTIVHVHGWTKCLSSAVFSAISAAGFRCVVTLHDYFLACPNGGFYDYRRDSVCERKPLGLACLTTNCDSRSAAHKVFRLGRTVTERAIAKAPSDIRHFVAVSDFSRRVMTPHLPRAAEVRTISNPIDTAMGPRLLLATDGPLLFAGRLSPEKGAVEAAAAAREADIPIAFAGTGIEDAEILRVNPSAVLLGWLSPAALRIQMKKSRALLFPSKWYETQGLVVQEAASLGIPVLVSDVTAAAEYQLGPTFTPSVEDLAALLKSLDAETLGRLGERAYDTFWKTASTMEAHLKDLTQYYEDILSD